MKSRGKQVQRGARCDVLQAAFERLLFVAFLARFFLGEIKTNVISTPNCFLMKAVMAWLDSSGPKCRSAAANACLGVIPCLFSPRS